MQSTLFYLIESFPEFLLHFLADREHCDHFSCEFSRFSSVLGIPLPIVIVTGSEPERGSSIVNRHLLSDTDDDVTLLTKRSFVFKALKTDFDELEGVKQWKQQKPRFSTAWDIGWIRLQQYVKQTFAILECDVLDIGSCLINYDAIEKLLATQSEMDFFTDAVISDHLLNLLLMSSNKLSLKKSCEGVALDPFAQLWSHLALHCPLIIGTLERFLTGISPKVMHVL